MAWIESPGPCHVYKSASCCSSFSPSFFLLLRIRVLVADRSIDRSVRGRSLFTNVGDPGSSLTSVIRVNVGRTCVSADRAPLRSIGKKSEHDSPSKLSSWFIADLPSSRSREQPRASPARAFVKRFCEHSNLPSSEENFLSRWSFLFWKLTTSRVLRFYRLFCAITIQRSRRSCRNKRYE